MNAGGSRRLRLLIGSWVLLVGTLVQAEVYRWTDAEGRVHFGDRAPQQHGGDLQQLSQPDRQPPADPQLRDDRERGRKLLQVWEEEKRVRDRDQAAADAARVEYAERCEQIAAELQRVERARYLYRIADDGERIVLEHDERQQYAEQLQALHQDHCS